MVGATCSHYLSFDIPFVWCVCVHMHKYVCVYGVWEMWHVPCTVLCTHTFTSNTTLGTRYYYCPILQTRKFRHTMDKEPGLGHSSNRYLLQPSLDQSVWPKVLRAK